MKTVLVIAYHFPPEEGTCSEKNIRIVKKLLESGYNVRVLTKDPSDNEPEVLDKCVVFRTNNGLFHKTKNAQEMSNSVNYKRGIKKRLKDAFSLTVIPDGVIDWIPEVNNYINRNKEVIDGVDVILSISSPYTAHIISRHISMKYQIPYILCYGDPWIYEPKRKRSALRYFLEKNIEKRIIYDSSGVLLITKWNKEKYKQLYNISDKKIDTYLIGFDDQKISDNNSFKKKDEKYSMLYGGSLDPIHRNIRPFLLAIKDIPDVYFEIRNNDYPQAKAIIDEYGVEEKVSYEPIMATDEFEEYQYYFDALILFGNKTPFQIPGKVFTYIKTKKRIIYIKNNNSSDDGTEFILRQYANSIIVQNESQSIREAILKILSDPEVVVSDAEISKYSFHTTMQPITRMIDNVTKTK